MEKRYSDEKAQTAMIDAARLADELRAEQEYAAKLEQECKLLDTQVKDAAFKLDEIEESTLKAGKKAVAKMESRVSELNAEMDVESRRFNDAQKNLRKSERLVKELILQQDEDNKNGERMQVKLGLFKEPFHLFDEGSEY